MRMRTDPSEMTLLPEQANAYYKSWLSVVGMTHGTASVAAFARSHRTMAGQQIEVFERGYSTWLLQRGGSDTAEAFAEYIGPRYQRWRGSLLKSELIESLMMLKATQESRAA